MNINKLIVIFNPTYNLPKRREGLESLAHPHFQAAFFFIKRLTPRKTSTLIQPSRGKPSWLRGLGAFPL
jgi:hypothetical protein